MKRPIAIDWELTLVALWSANTAAKEREDKQNQLKYEMDYDNCDKRRDTCEENERRVLEVL